MTKGLNKKFEGITIGDVKRYFKWSSISNDTVPDRMNQLVEKGILKVSGEGRYLRSGS